MKKAFILDYLPQSKCLSIDLYSFGQSFHGVFMPLYWKRHHVQRAAFMAVIPSFSEGMVMTLSFHTFDVLDFEKPWLVYRLEEESQIATKITTITLMQDVKNIRGH